MNDKGTIWETVNEQPMQHDDTEITPNNCKGLAVMVIFIVVAMLAIPLLYMVGFIKVDATDWVVCQTATGRVQVIDTPGLHFRPFARTWTYKRYSTVKSETSSHFKDGRARKIDTYIRVELPESTEARRELHRRFNGQMHNIEKMMDMSVTMALRNSTAQMESHYFDTEGLPKIVLMAKMELELDLPKYGLTLSNFGIHNVTPPVGEVPRAGHKSTAEIEAEIIEQEKIIAENNKYFEKKKQEAIEERQRLETNIALAEEAVERAKQEAIKDAEAMRDAYIKMHSSDGEN